MERLDSFGTMHMIHKKGMSTACRRLASSFSNHRLQTHHIHSFFHGHSLGIHTFVRCIDCSQIRSFRQPVIPRLRP